MRANLPSSRCSRRALGRSATFVAAARVNRCSILETEQLAEKKLDEFYAKVFGISLAAVFVLILILDAASSSTRTHIAITELSLPGIGANLEPFAQTKSDFAATDDAYATRPASQPLD
jgi:hypothetical protein